jgi:hypothetical protein
MGILGLSRLVTAQNAVQSEHEPSVVGCPSFNSAQYSGHVKEF